MQPAASLQEYELLRQQLKKLADDNKKVQEHLAKVVNDRRIQIIHKSGTP